MLRGLYTSALGMTTQMNRMNVVSNNIANINTNAYKKDKVVTQSFTEELMRHLKDEKITNSKLSAFNSNSVGKYSLGTFIDDIIVDYSTGSIKNTGGTLDLAILGKGFFAVNYEGRNGAQECYTRDGAFTLNANRILVTKGGVPVAGQNGNIQIPDGQISINSEGMIFVDGEHIDTIKMVEFEDNALMRKLEVNLYRVSGDVQPIEFSSAVQQGALEQSNVNAAREMAEMIEVSRSYEANQRMVTLHDSILQKISNDIGKK